MSVTQYQLFSMAREKSAQMQNQKRYQKRYQKEYRDSRRAMHMCYDCGVIDDYTRQGKTRCRTCSEKRAEKYMRRKK